MDDKPRVLIVGGGGGTRGALCVAGYERLEKVANIQAIVGTSINAWQSYAVATGNTDRLREMWLGVESQSDFMRRNLPLDGGLHSLKPLRKLVENKRWGLPSRRMEVGVFNWESGKHEMWNCNDRPLDDVLDLCTVSSSIFGVHDPVEWQGVQRGDGGHWSALPMPDRWWGEFDEVHLFICRPYKLPLPELPARRVNGLFERAMRFADVATHRSLRLTMHHVRRVASRRRDIRFYEYAPRSWRDTGPTFEPDAHELQRLIRDRLEHGEWMFENRRQL